ncbi:PLDc N-terminal domain-containing protein, partial [Halorubrum sp. SS7]
AGIALLIGLVFLVVHLAMIAWTYSDAESRSDHPPILWALIVFFAPVLGILLYFVIGRNSY